MPLLRSPGDIKRLLALVMGIALYLLFPSFEDTSEVAYLDLLDTSPVDGENGETITTSLPQSSSGACINGSGWVEEWISSGVMPKCSLAHRNKVDVLYAWVNGSESRYRNEREYWQEKSPAFKGTEGQHDTKIDVHQRRHREHDELRYSVRSVFKYFRDGFSHMHILTGDFYDGNAWVGQIPTWLDLELAPQYNVSVFFHSELYRGKKSKLPIFNVHALESQFSKVPSTSPDDDVMLYLNDDMFLASEHSVSDFWNPLIGVNIELLSQDWVPNHQPSLDDFQEDWNSEWTVLRYSNFLLSQRFGWRRRSEIAHYGKALSRTILRDLQNDFPSEYDETSSNRFRSEGKDISTIFLHQHYIMERHREILLESYLVHRSDANGDGNLDIEECQVLLAEIQAALERTVPRTTLQDRIVGMKSANIPLPKNAKLLWASTDGVPFALQTQVDRSTLEDIADPNPPMFTTADAPHNRIPPFDFVDMCLTRDLVEPCQQDGSVDAQVLFRLLSKEYPHCGDMLLAILIPSSPSGLHHLLPPTSHPKYSELTHLLQKYAYTISETSSEFIQARGTESLYEGFTRTLGTLANEGLAQFCVNDDIEEPDISTIEGMDTLFKGILQGYFGGLTDDRGRSPVEKWETVEAINDAGKEFWMTAQLKGGPGYE